jgi:hypothetical protein
MATPNTASSRAHGVTRGVTGGASTRRPARAASLLAALALTGGLWLAPGCAGQLRKPDEYRDDVAAMLATRADRVKACWDAELVRNPAAYGRVVLRFRVAKKSGAFERVDAIRERTTASEAVTTCVVAAVSGLAIDPPDAREAEATFEWSFRAPALSADGAP